MASDSVEPTYATDTPAEAAARAWLHSYGINTSRYVDGGGDHPAMRTLPQAFEAFARNGKRVGEKEESPGRLTTLQPVTGTDLPDAEAQTGVGGRVALPFPPPSKPTPIVTKT